MTVEVRPENRGWTASDATFAARLALVRQHMGWGNITEAAKACDVPTESWRNWERDGMEPRRIRTVAQKIATVTGCDFLWLLLGPGRGEGGGGATAGSRRRVANAARMIAKVGQPDGRADQRIRTHAQVRAVRLVRPLSQSARRPVTPVLVQVAD